MRVEVERGAEDGRSEGGEEASPLDEPGDVPGPHDGENARRAPQGGELLEGGPRGLEAAAAAREAALGVVDLGEPVDGERHVDLVLAELSRHALGEMRAVRREARRDPGALAGEAEEPSRERPLEERLAAEEAEVELPSGPEARDGPLDRSPSARLVETPPVLGARREVGAREVAGVREDESEREVHRASRVSLPLTHRARVCSASLVLSPQPRHDAPLRGAG